MSRLEQAHALVTSAGQTALAAAQRAVADGTASLAQYALVGFEGLDEWQQYYLARAPALVAREKAGMQLQGPDTAVAYPPEHELPEDVEAALDSLIRDASVTLEEMRSNRKQGRHEMFYVTTPQVRAQRAAGIVALGGRRAQGLRQRIWEATDGHWTISPDVMALAATTPIGPHFAQHSRAEVPHRPDPARPSCPTWRADATWAEVAISIERSGYTGDRSPAWSDQVRSGRAATT